MLDKMLKAYVVKEMVERGSKDASKLLKRKLKNWDSDVLLRKVGLTTYKPAQATTASLSFFLIGAAVGTVAALILAPKAGSELRTDLVNRFAKREGVNDMPNASSVRIDTPINARV